MEKYITDHYDLPDHRGDVRFTEWDKWADKFKTKSEKCKQKVLERIAEADDGMKLGEHIREINDFQTWSSYVKDDRYSLLMVGTGKALATDSVLSKKQFKYMGINTTDLFQTDDYLNVITSFKETVIPDVEDRTLEVEVGTSTFKTNVTIDNKDDRCSIQIEGEEVSRRDNEGLNIVVFDNGYRTVIDSVTLKKKDGDIVIER